MKTPGIRPADDDLERRLHATFAHDVERATGDATRLGLGVRRPASGTRSGPAVLRAWPVLGAAVAIALIALVVARGLGTRVEPPATPGIVGAPSAGPSLAPPSPAATDGPLPELRVGSEAEAWIAASTDGTPFIVSGWLLGSDLPHDCLLVPVVAAAEPLGGSCAGVWLHATPDGRGLLVIYRVAGATVPSVAPGMAQQVVVRAQTHDSLCFNADCEALPSVLAVAALGDPVAIPAPSAAAPPNGLTADDAESRAAMWAASALPGTEVATAAVAGPYGAVGAGGSAVAADRWVWAVTLAGNQEVQPSSAWVVDIDYVTGDFLVATSLDPADSMTILDGIPVSLDRSPVFQGDAARHVLATALETPSLVGGWLLGIDARVCPAGQTDPHEAGWDPCAGAWIHPDSAGGLPIQVYDLHGTGAALPAVAEGAAIAVVIRVHTNDAGCEGDDCRFPVVDAVAWTGETVDVQDVGVPPDGVSRAAADRAARDNLAGPATDALRFGTRVTLAEFEAITGSRIGSLGLDQDSWIWLLLYADGSEAPRRAQFAAVDLLTGRFLLSGSAFP